jgi:hypothetical protein
VIAKLPGVFPVHVERRCRRRRCGYEDEQCARESLEHGASFGLRRCARGLHQPRSEPPRGPLTLARFSQQGPLAAEFDVAEHLAYEKQQFKSLLWGLWSSVRKTVQTTHGERVELNRSLLWVLDWETSVRYDPLAGS